MAKQIKQGWKDTAAAAATPAKKAEAKRKQIFTLLFLFLALAGVTAAFIYLWERAHEPYFLPLLITEFKDRHFPANAQADQDRDALVNASYFPKKGDTFASQELNKIKNEMDNLKKRPAGDALVLHLSSHVIADEHGELYLIPGDATVDNPKSWYKLHDLLENVRACPSKQKLVILDIMRPLADPRLGVLSNDIADRVEAALDKVEDKDRLVLCAAAAGQVSLTSEDMGQSVFGFYVEDGLRGWADGFNPEDRADGRVSVRELANFVRVRVDRWARLNRDTRQTPVLFGAADIDFPLVVLEHGQAKAPKESEARDYPAWLRQAWELRDGWWTDQTLRLSPRLYRRLEATVLRAEQHWRGGVDPEKIQRELNKDLDELKKLAGEARAALPRTEQPRSLAQLAVQGKRVPAAAVDELRKLVLRLETLAQSGLKPDEIVAARAKLRDEFLTKLKGKANYELAWRVFEVSASETTPQPERLSFLYVLLSREQPMPLFVETLFLRRLDELAGRLKKDSKDWPTEAVRRGLHAVREGEKALACDPRALPWVRELLESAGQKRHDGEVFLFATGYASPEQAIPLFKDAVNEYQAINSYLETVQEAYRRYDEAMTTLPGIAPYLMNRAQGELRYENLWRDTVQVLRELQTLLASPPTAVVGAGEKPVDAADIRKRIDQLQQKTESLRSLMGSLLKPFSDEDVKGLMNLVANFESGKPAQCREIDDILGTTYLGAKQRQELWNAARKLSLDLHEKTRQQDKEDQDKERRDIKAQDFDTLKAQKVEQERTVRRAQVAIDLLKLGGASDVEKLELDFLQTARSTPKPTSWPALGNTLRQAWAAHLAKQFLDLKGDANLVARERLSRIIHPFDVVADADQVSPQWLRRQILGHWHWLGDRARYEKQDMLALGERVAVDFYDDAARDYLREASEAPTPAFTFSGGDTLNLRDGKRAAAYPLKIELMPSAGAKAAKWLHTITADGDWLRVTPEEVPLDGNGPFEVPLNVELKTGAELTSTLPPQGFLVSARLNARTFHHKVTTLVPGSKARQPQILVSDNPREPGNAVSALHLRPNTKQATYVYVRNPAEQARKLVVELKAEGHPADGTRSEVVELNGNETKRLTFIAKAAAPAEKDAEPPPLRGALQLRLLDVDAKQAVLDSKQVSVSTGSPRDYVQVSQAPLYLPEQRKLSVKVKARQPIAGPPCRVKLVLPKERIPGFIRYDSGSLEGDLPAGGEELTLTAEGLQFFDNRPDENGYIYLTVDDYERAFVFRTTFVTRGTVPAAVEVFSPAIRLQIPPFARPDAALRTRIEVDNAPSGVVIDVLMDRNNTNEFARVERLTGDRRERVGFTTAPDGALLFKTAVEDWSFDPDTRGITGPRPLRVVLVDKNNREIMQDTRLVILDETPPENGRINRIADKSVGSASVVPVPRAGALFINASASDRESGITEVFLFWGEPMEGKIPPMTKPVRAESLDDKKTKWSARLPLPADKKGEAKITAQFINGVGLAVFDTATIDIVEPLPAGVAAKKGPGKIEGKVVEGDRPQPNLEVVLIDDKGMPKSKTTTDGTGTFVFEDVMPGTYKVTSAKAVSQTKGESTVSVIADKASTVKVELFR